MPISVATALGELTHLIQFSLLAGLTQASVKNKLEACKSKRTYAHNALSCSVDEYPPITDITVSSAVDYLNTLDQIAKLTGNDLDWFKRSVRHERGNRLVRTVFGIAKDPSGLSELKISIVKDLVGRIDEIAETYDVPWDEVAQKLRKGKGNIKVSRFFASIEFEVEPSRTFDEILAEMPKDKPKLHDYQKSIVTNFNKIRNDKKQMHIIWLPTGAGKTLVANECANSFLKNEVNSIVLWLAPNWDLLEQAAINMAAFFDKKDELRRAGNSRKLLGIEKFTRRDKKARVIYTTIHSWHRGRRALFPDTKRPLLVVYDESHWGTGSKMLSNVFRYYLGKATLLGLSATPKEHVKMRILPPQKTYSDLVGTILAIPFVDHINTGVTWNPVMTSYQTFQPACLAELGDNAKRNELIVNELVKRLDTFNKVLVFACNKKHADKLNAMLCNKNVSSAIFHSGIGNDQRVACLNKFKNGTLKVLVSVNMATHGLDIPEIDCIVLARPTESAALCSQMVGRGARLAKGKTKFHILDFTDNMVIHPEYVFRPSSLFPPSIIGNSSTKQKAGAVSHNEPRTVSFQQLNNIPGVEGLQYAVDHTFGVEIELTAIPGKYVETVPRIDDQEWHRIAKLIIACLRDECIDLSEEPTAYHEGDTTRWRVEEDSSCGWEIISPPLRNQQGFDQLHTVCSALSKFINDNRELMIDFRCGLHITLSTKLKDNTSHQNVLRMVQRLEPGLFTLVKPSRLFKTSLSGYNITKNNWYCKPTREITIDNESFDWDGPLRFHAVNFSKAQDSDYNLFEVRMHHGTVDYLEIIPWISLWMHIFNSSRFSSNDTGFEGKLFARGNASIKQQQANKEDVFQLLENENITINNSLKATLLAKRTMMKILWENALPNRVDSWEDAGWYN